jgi:hypothetical protein
LQNNLKLIILQQYISLPNVVVLENPVEFGFNITKLISYCKVYEIGRIYIFNTALIFVILISYFQKPFLRYHEIPKNVCDDIGVFRGGGDDMGVRTPSIDRILWLG